MSEAVFRRLNPLTIAVEFGRVIARLIVPLVILMFGTTDQTEIIAQAIGGLAVFSAFARYWTFRYAIHDGTLTIRSGVLVKTVRSIPLENIQNINISKTVVHRLLGLVDLKIETASGGGSEASLSALSVVEAEKVKTELKGDGHQQYAIESKGHSLYRASTKELILAGATENRALAIIGAMMGFQIYFQSQLAELAETILPTAGGSWILFTAAAIAMLLIGWIFSIVSTFVMYAGFELDMTDGRIRRHYGLFNQIESFVPLRRIQAVRTTQTVLQRWFGVCKLYVETAGSYQKEDIGGSSLISPLLEFGKLKGLTDELLPGRDIDAVAWLKISPKSVLASVQRSGMPLVLAVTIVSAFLGWSWLFLLLPLLAYVSLLALLRFRTTGYGWTDQMFASRHGAFSKTSVYVPLERIQCVVVRQSPLQRRLGLQSVSVHTAAIGGGSHADVPDLQYAECETLACSLHQASIASASSTTQIL